MTELKNSPVSELEIRRIIVETAAHSGESAHIGGSLSMVELLNTLFAKHLRHRPDDPHWPDRDIFILSKGHAVLGYLAVLHSYGYFDGEKLATFQQNESDLIAHPVKKIDLGIESSNGSLGQGLSYGLGIAVGMRKRGQAERRVFVMIGDGECNEGSVWESAGLAAELGVGNLIAIVDENGLRNDGVNTIHTTPGGPVIADIWRAFGWRVIEVDGHELAAIDAAYTDLLSQSDKPGVIVAKTVKGKGIGFMEANNDWHHNRVTAAVLEKCYEDLGITPDHV
ncbi:transketolase [Ruegeria arenilitoris]|uniref:transketolase n=1 Tax=Ruegeria arenilitoris TaxID=1173585 RepID=UPI001C956589|nr:transketolase [Ruegeria arenilitoris]MBY6081863.1 transketolase [Ruegeria arenilitoris]